MNPHATMTNPKAEAYNPTKVGRTCPVGEPSLRENDSQNTPKGFRGMEGLWHGDSCILSCRSCGRAGCITGVRRRRIPCRWHRQDGLLQGIQSRTPLSAGGCICVLPTGPWGGHAGGSCHTWQGSCQGRHRRNRPHS